MKSSIKVILLILMIIVVGIVFRGSIYRNLVIYDSIGQRDNYPAAEVKLINYIESGSKDMEDPDIKQVIMLSLSLTSKHLNFTAKRNDNDPNNLIGSQTAHCVGYAHFFSVICNYLLEKHGLLEDWIVIHQIGQLLVFNYNIHEFFDNPFLKDHDFVIIKNKRTGESLAVDPTLHDYFRISLISNVN